jgi:hypothetical protein
MQKRGVDTYPRDADLKVFRLKDVADIWYQEGSIGDVKLFVMTLTKADGDSLVVYLPGDSRVRLFVPTRDGEIEVPVMPIGSGRR